MLCADPTRCRSAPPGPDERAHQRHRQPRAQPAAQRHQRAVGDERSGVVRATARLSRSRWKRAHMRRHPPVRRDHRPGHERRLVAREEQRHVGDLLRRAQPADRVLEQRLRQPGFQVAVAAGAQHRLHQRGVDRAGADDVDADAARREVDGHRAGQGDHRALRGAVGGEVRDADQPGHRALVDDRAARRMCGSSRLRHHERALGVHPQRAIPVVLARRPRPSPRCRRPRCCRARRSGRARRRPAPPPRRPAPRPPRPRPPRPRGRRPSTIRSAVSRRRVGRDVEHADGGALARRSARRRPARSPSPRR